MRLVRVHIFDLRRREPWVRSLTRRRPLPYPDQFSMALYGYARVSTFDQSLGIQRAALNAAGCEVVLGKRGT